MRRLQASEKKNRELEAEITELRDGEGEALASRRLERAVSSVEAQEVTWRGLVPSGVTLSFDGMIRLDAYYDSARADNAVIPFFVLPEETTTVRSNDDQFAFDSRLTRLGLSVDAGHIGDAVVTGRIEFDFTNFVPGVQESRATPTLRLAYIDLDFGALGLRVGQDWDVISPLQPSVHPEAILWNAGNLGDRRPQVQVRWESSPEGGFVFGIRASAGLTGSIANEDFDVGASPFASSERDGFDAGIPHGQLRLSGAFDSWVDGRRGEIGVWGYLGALETDVDFGRGRHVTSWVVGFDWTLPLLAHLDFSGQIWRGAALGDIRGGIGQSINVATGHAISSTGGFAELRWQVSDDVSLHGGASFDDPDSEELSAGFRDLNWTAYLGCLVDWGGGLSSGVDVFYWETQWVGLGVGNMVRVDAYVQLTF
ncbi:MAG TPA: hypothetical protein ENK43_16540 [Planctomycetes bacterium]|nr:hypothetical protein [Planctomycetota bacterium]